MDTEGERDPSGRDGSAGGEAATAGGSGATAHGRVAGVSRQGLGSRAPAFVLASRPLHTGWRVGVFVLGLAVVGGGVVLLPLPGPGWLVIFGGMAIWATEFVWAQLVLRWTRRKVTDAAHRALDPRVRRRNALVTGVVLAVVVAAVVVYLVRYGFVLPWRIGG